MIHTLVPESCSPKIQEELLLPLLSLFPLPYPLPTPTT